MVTEFLTTTLLGGIIYDFMKMGVSNSYELAKKSLKDFTTSEDDIRHLKLILEKDILIKPNLTNERIVEILENSEDISFLIKKVKNVNINHVEHMTINQTNKKRELPIINETFELYNGYHNKIFGITLSITALMTFLIHWTCIFICPILGFVFWFFSESKFRSFLNVYNNRLVFNGESIYYDGISSCEKFDNLNMVLKLYNTGKQEEVFFQLYREDDINFIQNSIYLYQRYNND